NSFGEIHESIVSWRDSSLGALSAKENSVKVSALQPRRSASTAVREFFSLSPMWLKGAIAFASIIFCVCAAMAVAYMTRPVNPNVVTVPSDKIYSQQQLDQRVAAALQVRPQPPQKEKETQPVTVVNNV